MNRPVLLFDLDGTLSDPSRGIIRCIRETLAQFDAAEPPLDELRGVIGPPLQETFGRLVPGRATDALTAFRDRYGTTGLFENDVYPGIEAALESLMGVAASMYVATSKPAEYAVRAIGHFRLERFFRAVYGSEMSGARADKSELLAHLVDVERIVAAEAIMIGDRSHDVVAARAMGMRSIGVTWGFGTAGELREAGADAVIDAPHELVKAIS